MDNTSRTSGTRKAGTGRSSRWQFLLVAAGVLVATLALIAAGYFFFSPPQFDLAKENTTFEPRSRSSSLTSMSLVPSFVESIRARQLATVIQRIDPSKDQGWESEVYAEQAQSRLLLLAELIQHPDRITKKAIARIAAPDISSRFLRPRHMQQVYSDGAIVVRRPAGESVRNHVESDESFSGIASLTDVLLDLIGPLKNAVDIRAKFKIVRIETEPHQFKTTVYYHSSGRVAAGRIQQNAVWDCRWAVTKGGPPLLVEIASKSFEEITPTSKGGINFEDCTGTVFSTTRSFGSQLAYGIDHWRSRLESNYGVDPNGNQGIAIGDVNGDGLEDIYICQQGGLPNRLYLQNADGTLKDVSIESHVDWMEFSRSALLLDLDNDGDQDLVICQGWYVLIMLNNGTGQFKLLSQTRCRADVYSMSAADYDNDGDVDLFLCGRNPGKEQADVESILGSPMPYHDANNGAPNMLWQNDGQGGFTEVTSLVGLDKNNRRFSYAASWADYDNDGDMDLYVANDFGRNNLYRNDNGTFEDVADQLGVEDVSAGMSVTWGDYDGDGRFDLYVSNMFSSAGNRIAYQRNFHTDQSTEVVRDFRRHARGNTLFRNDARQGFLDESIASGASMGRWAWGAKFLDLNNDGLEDLYVANGFITTDDSRDL